MPWIPDEMFESGRMFAAMLDTMHRCAQSAAKSHPNPRNVYAVSLLIDGDGNLIGDKNGQPVIFHTGEQVVDFDGKSVSIQHPEQRISTREAADLAGVHIATIKRAVYAGDLPAPDKPTERRAVHKLSNVVEWIGKRSAGK